MIILFTCRVVVELWSYCLNARYKWGYDRIVYLPGRGGDMIILFTCQVEVGLWSYCLPAG